MATIRVPLTHDGKAYTAGLPNFMEVPNSYRGGPDTVHHENGVHPGIGPEVALQHPITVEVIVPDRYVNEDGTLNDEEVQKDRDLIAGIVPEAPEEGP